MSPRGVDIALAALTQVGKPYVFGAEVVLDDPSPAAFDCSELVQWAVWRAGNVVAPDGSWIQQHWCYTSGGMPALDVAAVTPGVLVFRLKDHNGRPLPPSYVGSRPPTAHVGITIGDGRVVEALNRFTGVHVIDYRPVQWTAAFTVPQFSYQPPSAPPTNGSTEDDDMKPIYVQFGGAIWRRIGNVVVVLDQDTWDTESALAAFTGAPIDVITDDHLARVALQGCIDSRTGVAVDI